MLIALEPEVDEGGWDADDENDENDCSIEGHLSPCVFHLRDERPHYGGSVQEGWNASATLDAHTMEGTDRRADEGARTEEPPRVLEIPLWMFVELQSGKWPESCLRLLRELGSNIRLAVEGYDEWVLDESDNLTMKGLGLTMDWTGDLRSSGTAQMSVGNDDAGDHPIVEEVPNSGAAGPSSRILPTGENNASWPGSGYSSRDRHFSHNASTDEPLGERSWIATALGLYI